MISKYQRENDYLLDLLSHRYLQAYVTARFSSNELLVSGIVYPQNQFDFGNKIPVRLCHLTQISITIRDSSQGLDARHEIVL